jgi:hypothetical protein
MSPIELRRVGFAAIALSLAAWGWGCTEKLPAPTQPGPPGATRSVTPDSIQAIFLSNSFYCVGCHAGSSPPAGLNLTADSSYAHMFRKASINCSADLGTPINRVQPGVPDSSCVFIAVTVGMQCCGQMPYGGPYMTDSPEGLQLIERLRNWILNGAPATQVPL